MQLQCGSLYSTLALTASTYCTFFVSLPPEQNWHIPKVLAMAPGTHKGLKRSAKLSNRHEDTHLSQVRISGNLCGCPGMGYPPVAASPYMAGILACCVFLPCI